MVWALVPAKLGPHAKQRLGSVLEPSARCELARAMLCDVLTALRATPALDGVAVIGRGRTLRAIAESIEGVAMIEERAAETLNQAVAEGAAACAERGASALLVAMGDLPLLRPVEVERLLADLPERGLAVAPSADGTGTNLLAVRPATGFATAFGPDSLALHRGAAARAELAFVVRELAGAALDVDTAEDLARLQVSEAAAGETRRVLRALGLPTSSAPSASRSTSDLPTRPWSR